MKVRSIAALLALLALLPACSAQAPEPTRTVRAEVTPRIERYVALGDSFAAGPGIAPTSGGACARSGNNYAALLAQELDARLHDVSCSGARIADFAGSQYPDTAPQFDALTPNTTLVTLGTIGGNDVNLVALATSCVFGTCGVAGDPTPAAIEALEPRLRQAINEVKARAPKADIVVVGYGTYLNVSCAALSGVTGAEARWLQAQIDHLSDVLKAAAEATDVTFADMRAVPGADRHGVCAAPDQQWLRGLETYGDGAMMHPSSRGMSNWAQYLVQVVRGLRDQPVEPWAEITDGPTAATTSAPAPAR